MFGNRRWKAGWSLGWFASWRIMSHSCACWSCRGRILQIFLYDFRTGKITHGVSIRAESLCRDICTRCTQRWILLCPIFRQRMGSFRPGPIQCNAYKGYILLSPFLVPNLPSPPSANAEDRIRPKPCTFDSAIDRSSNSTTITLNHTGEWMQLRFQRLELHALHHLYSSHQSRDS